MEVERAREETIQAYQVHAGAVLGYAHRLTRDDALAQDTVQETFLRYFLAMMQDQPIQNARAWLHRVAHNYVCETVRSVAVRKAVSLEDAGGDCFEDERAQPDVPQPGDWLESVRLLLAPREWQCLQLRAEGFDYTEIAAELSIRPGTVGTLLHRATEKLRSRVLKRGIQA